jgi:plastocyanin
MKSRLMLVLAVAAVTALSSCGSDTAPTNPGSGARELNSGDFGPGGTFEHRFLAAGSFPYHCVHHAPMTGTVQVDAAATDTLVAVSIVSSSAPFPAASVKPGGRVVWTNNTSMVHTVTSN